MTLRKRQIALKLQSVPAQSVSPNLRKPASPSLPDHRTGLQLKYLGRLTKEQLQGHDVIFSTWYSRATLGFPFLFDTDRNESSSDTGQIEQSS